MESLTDAITPAAAAAKLLEAGVRISERTLRERARALGACRIIGKTMFLMPSDIDAILEAAKPAPRVPRHMSGAWTDEDSRALRQRLQSSSRMKKVQSNSSVGSGLERAREALRKAKDRRGA